MTALNETRQPAWADLAPTPPMGWNSWNGFAAQVSEEGIRQTVEALIASGMREVGYQYVVLDDFWQGGRDQSGKLFPHPTRFPSGIRALADYVHERGLKLGIYSDAAEKTCGGEVGSFGFEEQDARTFAEWEVDFLKYDYCHAPTDQATAIARYTAMGQALQATGRPIVYSICEWGGRQPWLWARQAGGHLWRTTPDLVDRWSGPGSQPYFISIEEAGFVRQAELAQYAGPGGWNDPDMLVVGLHGRGAVEGPGCTDAEYRSHMSLWCLQAAPLMVGCDLRTMSETTRETLTNPEVIALDQDSSGAQARRMSQAEGWEVWQKPLQGGGFGVGLFNRSDTTQTIGVNWATLGLSGRYLVRDLWARSDLGDYTDAFEASVETHECKLFQFLPSPLT